MPDKSSSSGLNLYDALAVLFIGLKLANVIDWPWWAVVLAPIGIALGIAIPSAIIAGAVVGIVYAFSKRKR